ncbi:hypothetical protein AGMMS50262_22190 [Bacteroidia bacterium]|nr:hypothetical protein AGMMS50262_22190 [Bacteroidia bacterium]
MKTFIINILILFVFTSCCHYPTNYSLFITNNSVDALGCYYYLVWEGGKEGIVYPDTTLVSLRTNEVIGIKAGQTFHDSRPLSPITEWISSLPHDTLSVFFFSKDTLNAYSWEEIKLGYKILQRYDLSIEDINLLYNKYGVPEIPYPPSEVMRDMKMYPPYGK